MHGNIEYLRSEPIAPEEVRKYGSFTILPVRRHVNPEAMDAGEQQARKEWEHSIGDGIPRVIKGTENPVTGTWDSLVMPECRPELLSLVGRMSQSFFMVDEKADRMSRKEAHQQLNMPFDHILGVAHRNEEAKSPLERMFFPVLRDLLQHDYERAIVLFEGWRDWLQNVDTKDESTLESLEAHLRYREANVGFL